MLIQSKKKGVVGGVTDTAGKTVSGVTDNAGNAGEPPVSFPNPTLLLPHLLSLTSSY